MNTESTEYLSSLMDGEVNQETGRFLVRRLGADGELRQTWARYHLIRDCLRHQDGKFAQHELSSRVRQALSVEPEVSVRSSVIRSRWMKPFAGAAIAASVAMVAILMVSGEVPSPATPPSLDGEQPAVAESFVSPNPSRLVPVSQPVNLSGGLRQDNRKFNTYLLRHYQVTEQTGGGRGFVSYIPIVVTQPASRDEEAREIETDLR